MTEPHICKNSVLNALSDKADLLDEKSGNDRAIARAVKVIDAASGQIGVRQAEIDGLEKKVKDQIGDVAAHNERIAKLKAEQVPYRDLLEAATKSKAALEQTNASVVANLESTRAKLTATTTLHFRPSEVQRQEEIGGAKNAADRWFNTAELAKACVVNVNPIPCDATHVPIELKAWIGAHVIVPMRNPDTTRSDGAGVVYREPARGALLVCKKLECLDANKQLTVIPENVVLSQVVDFPQLGVKAKLDLVNKAFQNNTLVAAFSEAGSLTRLEYKSNARAEKAAETFASSAESIQQLVEAKRDSKRKDLEAKTAEVAAETELGSRNWSFSRLSPPWMPCGIRYLFQLPKAKGTATMGNRPINQTSHPAALTVAYEKAQVLLRRPDVTGVAIGSPCTAGVIGAGLGICVYVSRKLPLSDLDPMDVIPTNIDGFRVDVVERVYKPVALSVAEIRQRRIVQANPMRPGIAASLDGGEMGTLGLFVKTLAHGNRLALLSAAHVLAPQATSGATVLQPHSQAGGRKVGSVIDSILDSDGDAAIAEVDNTVGFRRAPIGLAAPTPSGAGPGWGPGQ